MNECDHITGIIHDYADTRLNHVSDNNSYKKYSYQEYIEFNFCPNCGEKLSFHEKECK